MLISNSGKSRYCAAKLLLLTCLQNYLHGSPQNSVTKKIRNSLNLTSIHTINMGEKRFLSKKRRGGLEYVI